MIKWICAGMAGIALAMGAAVLWGSYAPGPKSQASPTLAPTPVFREQVRRLGEGISLEYGVHYADQIQVRREPQNKQGKYYNIQDYANDLVKHGGGSEVVDLEAGQYLHIGGTPPTGNQEWLSLTDLQGAVILAEGGSIVFQEQPKRGLQFTIIAETSYPQVESINWNSVDGALFRVANGVSSTFPEAPWGETVKEGDILNVNTPYDGRPRAVFDRERAETIGDGDDLLITRVRVGGQRAGVIVRSVEEMRGRTVLIHDLNGDGKITNIMMNWNQPSNVFPRGWYMDFYNRNKTPDVQERFFARGQVIWPASGQTWTFGEGVNGYGPYDANSWYRITARNNDEFQVIKLSPYIPPTATPQPTATPYTPPAKSWKPLTINSNQLNVPSSRVDTTCSGAVKYWVGTNENSNQLAMWNVTPGWERIKFVVWNVGVDNLYYTEEISHPGTVTNGSNSVTIAGTPRPYNPQQYPINANQGVKLHSLTDNQVWLYTYDRRGARQEDRTLGTFRASDIARTDFCFAGAWEWR